MSTPILNPNSSSTINAAYTTLPSPPSHMHLQLGQILQQYDPNATRLYDFINHVKVYRYNPNENRWENTTCIEGNLFIYGKQQILNNQKYRSFAFAIINQGQGLIQEVAEDMQEQIDKLILFYEVMRNDKREIFSLHFLNENECQRLHTFINRSIQYIKNFKGQQSRGNLTGELQLPQTNEQKPTTNVYRQQTPINTQNFNTPQFGLSRQTPVQQSIPVINVNSNSEDPTSSLKRLLNIPIPNSFDNEPVSLQQQSINLLPPSAFETLSSLPMGAENNKYNLSPMNREHFRNVLLHLVQTNDHFLDIIHQACLTHQSQ